MSNTLTCWFSFVVATWAFTGAESIGIGLTVVAHEAGLIHVAEPAERIGGAVTHCVVSRSRPPSQHRLTAKAILLFCVALLALVVVTHIRL